MMNLEVRIKDFCQKKDLNCVQSRDIISELGDFSKEILKSTQYGKIPLGIVSINIITEIRDGYFSLLGLIKQLRIEIDSTIQMAIDKNKKRLSTKGCINSNKL